MAPINFAGKLPVAVTFQWQGDFVVDSLANRLVPDDPIPSKSFRHLVKNFRYILANDLVTAFTINVGGATPFAITRKATSGNPMFDTSFNAFTTHPAPGPALDTLINDRASIPCTVDLTFTYLTFWDTLLAHVTRVEQDLHNIANPKDQKAVLDTFIPSVNPGTISATYKSKSETIKNIPARLSDSDVTPRPGKPPAVKLTFTLDFSPFGDVQREAMRKLIALDWSKLARHGEPATKAKPLKADRLVWLNNIDFYLLNHVDIERGHRIFLSILNRQKSKSGEELARSLREDIDLHLVTANHWGEEREDAKREAYQRRLSDLFGTVHQKALLASPVARMRTIDELFFKKTFKAPITEFYPKLALQFGTGHCGEHSDVSFAVLEPLTRFPETNVFRVVKTGNANVDHEFVLFNVTVETDVLTITTNPKNSRGDNDGPIGKGKPIRIFNLREAIERTKPASGFVMDPYLDRTVTKFTAKDLLDAINSTKRGAKQTEFLAFHVQVPKPQNFGTIDNTAASEEVRARFAKNV